MARTPLTTAQRRIVGVVAAGAVLLAAIGFAGSYAAVRHLAERKGFGEFALILPVGIDAGIGVLLALDLLLSWLRIPYPALRPAAWVLTVATVAFNAAASWPDPIAVGMHAVIPILFIVTVEAARHAVGRIANITADKHMDGVRLIRWLLAPVPTFKLWRRMKLWELRSYDDVIRMEQDRIVYRMQLRARYGRAWRRRAPVAELMPLRLARYGKTPRRDQPVTPTFDRVADEAVAVATPTPKPVASQAPRQAVAAGETPPRRVVHEPVAPPATDTTDHDATPTTNPATPTTPQTSDARHLTVADVARLAGVKPGTVRKWKERGRLTPASHDSKGRDLFDRDTVAALIEDSK